MRLPRYCLLVLIAAGCGSTASIEQEWRAPSATQGELTNVVTVVPTHDGALRRNAEEKLAAQLNSRGMRATPSYTVLQSADTSDRAQVAATLRGAGFDGVVTMRFVSKSEHLDYEPGYGYWGGWDMAMPETIVRIQINAYSLNGDRLVWSALSKSTDPDSVQQLINDVTALAASELAKKQVITASR